MRSLPGTAYRRVVAALEAKGCGPPRGENWRCPAHDDHNPSLSVKQGDDRALVHCHKGCEASAVLRALGLTMADLFDNNTGPHSMARNAATRRPRSAQVAKATPLRAAPEPSKRSERVADYLYRDAGDEAVARKVRFEPGFDGRSKSFSWEVPDERGGWRTAKGEGNPRVLYRLPELLAALDAGDTVYFVEGEKDADTLDKAGAVATCNPEGANAKAWREVGYAETFRSARGDVRVIADRDEIGYRFAVAVLDSLRAVGVAARCFEARKGKDASDHLAADFALDDLVEVDPAERLADGEPESDELRETRELRERFSEERTRVDAWLSADGLVLAPPARKYLVADLMPERVPMLLVARGGTGKGHFELALALSLALGEPFGRFTVPRPRGVVFVAREDDREELHRRFAAAVRARFGENLGPDRAELLRRNLRFVDLFGVRGGRLGEPLVRATVEAAKRLDEPGLVMFDPLGKLLTLDSAPLNTQEGAGLVHEWLDVVVQETGFGVLAAHHVNKDAARSGQATPGAATGSQLLEDFARFVLVLTRVQGEDAQKLGLSPLSRYGYVQATVTKQNYAPPLGEPFVFEQVEGGALVPREALSATDIEEERALRVLEEAGRSLTRDEWEKGCEELEPSIPKQKARNARTRLKHHGLVLALEEASTDGKGGAKKLRFTPSPTARYRDAKRFEGIA